MKKCPYCGKEHPDDAEVCVIDQTPLDKATVEPVAHGFAFNFALVSENKIPVSLIILSYLYFIPAALIYGWVGFMVVLCFMATDFSAIIASLVWILVGLAVAIFYTCLSRGLRRCSRGWRTCVLILTSVQVVFSVYGIVRHFSENKPADHTTMTEYLLTWALGFFFLLWQYRVLTRPDIKELFGVD